MAREGYPTLISNLCARIYNVGAVTWRIWCGSESKLLISWALVSLEIEI